MTRGTVALLLVWLGIHTGGCADCPEGWTYYGGNCYMVLHDVMTWYEARMACNVIGGKMVEIMDADQNTFLTNLLQTNKVAYAWTGLEDLAVEGKLVWASDGSSPTYHNFHRGEPSDAHGHQNQDCVAMRSTGEWYDDHCHSSIHSVICQNTSSGLGGQGEEIVG